MAEPPDPPKEWQREREAKRDAALAQTSRGTVSGLVLDPQQLAVPGSAVELTNNSTNIVRATTTNEAGLYRFDAMDPLAKTPHATLRNRISMLTFRLPLIVQKSGSTSPGVYGTRAAVHELYFAC